MTHVLSLLGWQPTAVNVLIRMHHRVRSQAVAADAQVIALEAIAQKIPLATGPRRVSLTIHYTKKGRGEVDPDALYKSLLDGLRHCGLLREDNRHWCELGPVTYELKHARGVVVTLEDL